MLVTVSDSQSVSTHCVSQCQLVTGRQSIRTSDSDSQTQSVSQYSLVTVTVSQSVSQSVLTSDSHSQTQSVSQSVSTH